jgi:hypothetical protein
MMPHLGVLAQVHARASVEVFERDCLVYLGTCVAAAGTGKPGKTCCRYTIRGGGLEESGELAVGDLRLFPLAADQTAKVRIEPAKGFDFGAGPGHAIEREARGGTVGLVLDARGRPLALPADAGERRQAIARWVEALELYPEPVGV